MTIKLEQITIYPVKSMSGTDLDVATVKERGLEYDRRLMVIDSGGRFVSQREIPGLAAVTAARDSNSIDLASAESGEIRIDLSEKSRSDQEVEIWGQVVRARTLGEVVNEWMSKAVGKAVSLVIMDEDSDRPFNPDFGTGQVSFADGYPVLLTNQASLEALNDRLEAPVGMERFRPNLVVSGAAAFEEDEWKYISIGDSEFKVAKPCARCVVTTIDQASGTGTGKEPLASLYEFRKAEQVYPDSFGQYGLSSTDVLFGMNLIPLSIDSEISVGDEIVVNGFAGK